MKLLGFLNLGNTCYFNSVLQCFVNDKLFQKTCDSFNDDTEFVTEIQSLLSRIHFEEPENNMSFKCNISSLCKHFPDFKRFQQHDAHEFLILFIDKLISNYAYKETGKEPEKDSWKQLMNKSPFSNIYHGQTVNKILCTKCNKQKYVFEEFNTINLTVHNHTDLRESFDNYLKTEIHDDPDNLYFCETCNTNTITHKKLYLNMLPKRLIIVLKRYNAISKINSLVNYEYSLLIKETSTNDVKRYKLHAVIHHLGNLTDGHYTCSVLINDNWFFIDDELIQLDENIKCDVNAYILIYHEM